MRTEPVTLEKGLTVGRVTHLNAIIREATAADIIDATEEAEKVVMTEDGPALVASPTFVGLHTLRRQVVSIGEHEGPLTVAELKLLSAIDLNLLQNTAQQLENAALAEVAKRGCSNSGEASD